MDACELIENEVGILVRNLNNVKRNLEVEIDKQIAAIEKLQRDIARNSVEERPDISRDDSDLVRNILTGVNKTVSKISKDHKECKMSVWKIGKAIDDSFLPGIDIFPGYNSDESLGQDTEKLISVVLEYFARDGRLDVCRDLVNESGIAIDCQENETGTVVELNKAVEALKSRDVGPALTWVTNNRENLIKLKNTTQISLELKIHRLKFLDILMNGDRIEGLKYARKNFPSLISDQKPGVLSLMGAIMYSGSALLESPYCHLAGPTEWQDTADLLLKSACSMLGMSMESPLLVAVNAGCMALPDIILTKQIMQKSGQEKVPVDVELSEEFSFHSVFVCPVLKQQVSENIHPYKLVCGHVISRIALAKLVKPGLRVSKLKCPSCRHDQNPAKARQVFF